MESNEGLQSPAKENVLPKGSEGVYIKLLGTDKIPEKAEGFPQEVFIPPDALGQMEQAVIDSGDDQNERSQFIRLNVKTGKLEQSKVFIGTTNRTGNRSAFSQLSRNFLSKALIDYHVHPSYQYDKPQAISEQDMAVSISNPKAAFIEMVATRRGVHAIFQRAEISRRFFAPNLWKIKRRLFNKHWTYASTISQDRLEHSNLAHIIESEGFVHYFWKPPERELKPGDMSQGITMKKTKPEPIPDWVGKR